MGGQTINRATLPSNFLESVTSRMRLPTPEPQYLFAQMFLGGMLRFAALNAGQTTAQQYVTIAGNGVAIPPDLDRMIRVADMLPDAVISVEELSRGPGDTVKMHRPIYDGGGYTEDDRAVRPDKTTSTDTQAVRSEEVVVTLREFEGPYNTTNSRVQPYGIRDFDAKYAANKEQLASITTLHLTRDYIKWIDTVGRDRFRSTSNITYAASSVTSVSSYVAGAGYIANLRAFLNAKRAISDREWRPFANGRYVCLVPTAFNTPMVEDYDYQRLSKNFAEGRNLIFSPIASIQDIDFYECTTLKSYAAGASVPGDANVVPSGVRVHEALMFGPGTVGWANALSPEARFADDTDYGKVAKVIWYAIHGFQTLDSRGIQRILFQEDV